MLHADLHFDRAERAVRHGGREGAGQALLILLRHSLSEVPRDTGALAASGRIETYDSPGGRVVFDAPYAIIQHERTDFVHPKGGRAKFLENPAADSGVHREMLAEMAGALRKSLK